MRQSKKTKPKIKKLIIKQLGSYVIPVAKGLCYDTLLYTDRKVSAIKFTSKSE